MVMANPQRFSVILRLFGLGQVEEWLWAIRSGMKNGRERTRIRLLTAAPSLAVWAVLSIYAVVVVLRALTERQTDNEAPIESDVALISVPDPLDSTVADSAAPMAPEQATAGGWETPTAAPLMAEPERLASAPAS